MTLESFVYLAIVPSLIITIGFMVRMHYWRKHDIVLFRFCGIRRDMMALLMERGVELDLQDYEALRTYLRTVNNLIQSYSDRKFELFNFRKFVAFTKSNAQQLKSTSDVPVSGDQEIKALQFRTTVAIAQGFFAYTPFVRSEFFIRVLAVLIKLMARVGVKAISERGQNYLNVASDVELMRHYQDRNRGPECTA